MLKITPYLGIFVIIVSIGGLWFPKLGYFLIAVFVALLLISPFKGRWFCGNLCPRGSFQDFWISWASKKSKIPGFFRSYWLRVPVFIVLMNVMVYRVIRTAGIVDRMGLVFVVMCIVTTLISIGLGVYINPRAWCMFCPMGTVQRWFGGKKYQLKLDEKKCISCKNCDTVCPMGLNVSNICVNPDCIKCERCVKACPTKALRF